MFDCDGLKKVNDDYGHEKGDLYLRNACGLICRTYAHSPVFRVGGDEFVALLEREDYSRREELLAAFNKEAGRLSAAAAEPWERVCVSAGVAVYDPAVDRNAGSVLSRADSMMYENKRGRKAALP